jgi:hypothetical protein
MAKLKHLTKICLIVTFILANTFDLLAQLETGDIAFVGFNADGDDDIAFVALNNIPVGTTIYFCDSEWDGTAFGDDENDIIWNSGTSLISAGTVIVFNQLDGNISTSIGSISGGTGLSKNGDALFAYLGTDVRQPTTFLAAIANITSAFGELSGTGLLSNYTAIVLPETADIAKYNGPRTGIDTNGYFAQFNKMSNWLIQDTDNNDHNDGSEPDLPFETTPFTFSGTDVSAPYIIGMEVESDTVLEVMVSERISNATVTNLANYNFTPTSVISNIEFDTISNTINITHTGLQEGVATYLIIRNLEDTAGIALEEDYQSENFFYNESTPNLLITEIMYNAPVSFDDDVEFIEIFNSEDNTVHLGGIKVKDEGNFSFIFPQMTLASKATVLLATNKEVADTFYNATFIDLATTGNTLGNGGELLQMLNTKNDVIFEVEYDNALPWPKESDGEGSSLELLNPDNDANMGANWKASSAFLKSSEGAEVYASPGTYTPFRESFISFANEYIYVNENAGSISFNIDISEEKSSEVTVDVSIVNAVTTASESDFIFKDSTITFTSNSTDPISIEIPINDNVIEDVDKMLVLKLSNVQGGELGAITDLVIYIMDDEESVPIGSNSLDMEYVGSYLVDEDGSAEIVAYDSASQRLFVLNSTAVKVVVLDFKNPKSISEIKSFDMSGYGTGATSIATKNGLVAATVETGPLENGTLVLLDTSGNEINSVKVGNLPDMVTFTPDGNYILTANEGQPSEDYLTDPEGSISMIDISNGAENVSQDDVVTISFTSFDDDSASLVSAGVRIFGYNACVSKDLEPEYITVSEDSKTAWVTLQENNAIGVIDLENKVVKEIRPLGTKDHSLKENVLDVSDKNDSIVFSTYPIKGMYMPDAIANYSYNGATYLVTANEGDQREYDNIDEDVSVGDDSYVLDETIFPEADILKKKHLLGRIAVSPYSGDIDGDGDFDEIHVFGSRSFSIWNGATGDLVYDSGDDFEKITANDPEFKSLFNASNSNNKLKNRSDNKGPEPEGVFVAEIGRKVYAFITLERIGGVMAYDITNPAMPTFDTYLNSRMLGDDKGGDLGPEGIIYIPADVSPNDTGMVVVANEESATVSIFYLNNDIFIPVHSTEAITACESYTWPANGINYSESGTYTDTLTNIAGYDSVATLKLTINHPSTGIDAVSTCGSYTWIDGVTYTENNNSATYKLENAVGCDSLVTLNLKILEATSSAISITETKDSYTAPDGSVYTEDGTYTAVIENIDGCDSTITITLTFDNSSGLNSSFAELDLSAYPNPTKGLLNIRLAEIHSQIIVHLVSISGEVVKTNSYKKKQNFSFNFEANPGIYILHIRTEKGSSFIRIINQ